MAIEGVVEEVVEEVATNLEEVANATRRINAAGLSYLAIGLGIGGVVGFFVGHKFNKAKIRAEAFAEAEEDISEIREVYLQKSMALSNTTKPDVEDIVAERGYSVGAPGYSVVAREEPPRELKAPVPLSPPAALAPRTQYESMREELEASKVEWDYDEELLHRTPEAPYVIHQNEYNHSNPNYSKAVYTYWSVDDVVTDSEDDHPISHADMVVGLTNLKFGHGSDDENVVYIRNDRLETDIQIVQVNRSYEEEKLGLTRNDGDAQEH